MLCFMHVILSTIKDEVFGKEYEPKPTFSVPAEIGRLHLSETLRRMGPPPPPPPPILDGVCEVGVVGVPVTMGRLRGDVMAMVEGVGGVGGACIGVEMRLMGAAVMMGRVGGCFGSTGCGGGGGGGGCNIQNTLITLCYISVTDSSGDLLTQLLMDSLTYLLTD